MANSCTRYKTLPALLVIYGNSVITMACRVRVLPLAPVLLEICSMCAFARIITLPCPVLYSFRAPSWPRIKPPVGKSGAGIILVSSCVGFNMMIVGQVKVPTGVMENKNVKQYLIRKIWLVNERNHGICKLS